MLDVNNRCRINVKLGGINVIPKASSVQFLTDPSNPTLVLGCDVMHPAPGPSYRSRPSFTALTGNIDSSSSRFIATSRAQDAGVEMVADLEDMVFVRPFSFLIPVDCCSRP